MYRMSKIMTNKRVYQKWITQELRCLFSMILSQLTMFKNWFKTVHNNNAMVSACQTQTQIQKQNRKNSKATMREMRTRCISEQGTRLKSNYFMLLLQRAACWYKFNLIIILFYSNTKHNRQFKFWSRPTLVNFRQTLTFSYKQLPNNTTK